jgi:hypothetical protein
VDVEEGEELGECQVDDLVAIRYHLKTARQQRPARNLIFQTSIHYLFFLKKR